MSLRRFDGKVLKDAEEPLIFPVLSIDQAAAEAHRTGHVNVPENFATCVLAEACLRTFGQNARVSIMRKTAYVSLHGERYARRYEVSPEAYETLSAFDRGETYNVDVMIRLLPPCQKRTLKAMRSYAKGYEKQRGGPKTSRKQRNVSGIEGELRHGMFMRRAS